MATKGPIRTGRVGALDGLRGVAIAAVVAFHADAGWLGGGFLGVSLFFTLSGFLITSLLLNEVVDATSRDLAGFWWRRLRRLGPAALTTVAAVVVVGRFLEPAPDRGEATAAALYVSNWRNVAGGDSYADLFRDPSPLLHYWSLAVEEQVYLGLPLLLLAVAVVGGGRRSLLLVVAGAATVATALPWLADMSPDRWYYGTDVRVAEVLVGAALALMLGGVAAPPGSVDRGLRRASPAAALALVGTWVVVASDTTELPRGLLTLHAILTAIVIAGAVAEGSPLVRALSVAPLQRLGRISYSLYLVHWPVFVFLTGPRLGLDGARLRALQLGLSLALATGLHHLVEEPLRRGSRPRRRRAGVVVAAAVGAAATALALPAATVAAERPIEQTAEAVRPPGLTGSTVTELAAAASAIDREQLPEPAAVDPAGADPAIALDLTQARGRITRAQAAAIAASTGTGTDFERSLPVDEHVGAFDYEAESPRILVFGDSAALMLGYGLDAWGAETGSAQFLDLASVGCGLLRGGEQATPTGGSIDTEAVCGDWAPAFASLRDLLDPDAVVFHFGLWDTLDRRLPGVGWRSIGDPAYDALVGAEAVAATEIFTDHGIPVVWISSPRLLASRSLSRAAGFVATDDPWRVRRLNDLIADAVGGRSLAAVVDLHGWFEDHPGGPLDPALRPDGIHVTETTSLIVAEWLAPQVMGAVEQLSAAGG